jgi:hypothetical protein
MCATACWKVAGRMPDYDAVQWLGVIMTFVSVVALTLYYHKER